MPVKRSQHALPLTLAEVPGRRHAQCRCEGERPCHCCMVGSHHRSTQKHQYTCVCRVGPTLTWAETTGKSHPTTSTQGNTLSTRVSSDTEKSESSYTDGGNMKWKMVHRDFPACQCRGHGFNPWFRKILPAAEQLSLWSSTTETHRLWGLRATVNEPVCLNYWSPCALEPVLHNKKSHCNEKSAHCSEE